MTKLCATLVTLNIALGGMAIDYKKVARTQKLDAQSIIEVQKMQQAELEAPATAKSLTSNATNKIDTPRLSALVKLHSDTDANALSGQGFDAKLLCNHFAIVNLSADSLDALADVEDVERISFGKPEMELMLSKANQMTGVNLIHQGTAGNDLADRDYYFRPTYTGKGSMIGIFDSGFDPNHAMFLDEKGVSRFKMIGTKALNGMTEDSATIATFQTDTKNYGHATHVSGIAAGNFKGDNFELQGVAPDADLALAPILSTPEDLFYLTAMAEYCQKHNKRLITNMSYGNFDGPHDGSDIFSQALDEIINKYDIVACVSAGNEADNHIVQRHTFASDEEEMKAIYDLSYSGNSIKNYITTEQDTPIDIDLIVVNYRTKDTVKVYKVVEQGELIPFEYGDNIINSAINIAKESIHDSLAGYSIEATDLKVANSAYRVGYIIRAKEGQCITSYTSKGRPFSLELANDGWAEGITSNGAVNALACANEIISVGAYNSTVSMKLANGKSKNVTNSNQDNWGVNEGDITYYSSFGTRYDGRLLPTVCAPGAYLESAFNRYNRLTSAKSTITRNDNFQGTTYSFCAMSGTSMASPYMAGIAALWLEANPNLTHREIRDIAILTANNDDACTTDNYFKEVGKQAGAGKVDAYAGLMYILGENEATLVSTPTEKKFLVRHTSIDDYEAFLAGATSLTATLYNIEGKKALSTSTTGNRIQIHTSGLSKGIYILSVNSSNKSHRIKIAIK